jgi:hypothetical protein
VTSRVRPDLIEPAALKRFLLPKLLDELHLSAQGCLLGHHVHLLAGATQSLHVDASMEHPELAADLQSPQNGRQTDMNTMQAIQILLEFIQVPRGTVCHSLFQQFHVLRPKQFALRFWFAHITSFPPQFVTGS